MNLALLSGRGLHLLHPLRAEDTELFLGAMARLGWSWERGAGGLELRPGSPPREAELWCGNNGTMLRFLTAALTTIPGRWTLDGSARLRQRPIGPLVSVLRDLGARLRCLESDGFAPLEISGTGLGGGAVELDAGISSQFGSALMMAATQAAARVDLKVLTPVSEPYLAITRQAVAAFGGSITRPADSLYRIEPASLAAERFEVEADYSAAAYGAAAAVVTGGRVVMEGLPRSSAQGDRVFLEVLARMGAGIEWRRSEVVVSGGENLNGVALDLSDMPDQVPTLAAIAPFARGKTTVTNVRHLRFKESDRIQAMVSELNRLGAKASERSDGLEVEGSWAGRMPPTEEARVKTYGDHRIAMSLAVCGLRRPGVIIENAAVVRKSYPGFWQDLATLLEA